MSSSIEGTQRGYLATVYRPDGSKLDEASFPTIPAHHGGSYGRACDAAYAAAKAWLALYGQA